MEGSSFIRKKRKLDEMTTHYHSLSFVVTRCHSLSLVVIRCHSLLLDATRCHSLYHSSSFIVAHCHSWYHSLSLDVLLFCLIIAVKFYPEIFESNNLSQIIKTISLILRCNMFGATNVIFFLLLLISEYVQKCK